MSIEQVDAARGDTINRWAEAVADRQSSRLPPSSVHPSTPPPENTVELSPVAELLAKVEMLAQSDPTRFRDMASQLQAQLQGANNSGGQQPPYAEPHVDQRAQAILDAVMDQIYAAIGRIV